LSASDFDKKIKETPNAIILDVRTEEEFAAGHIKGAVNINLYSNNFEKEILKIKKNKSIFVYCLSGGRSSSAAGKLKSNGFNSVFNLNGGMMSWRSAGLEEQKGNISQMPSMSSKDLMSKVSSSKITIVDFYAEWCAPCKIMKPYLEEMERDMSATINILRIDADKNQDLSKELNVDALPTILIYKNGKLKWRNVGFISKEDLLNRIKLIN